ncbi:unnamed protein product [Kuraishia capsulata CBS 1993]|uniref:EF-hand domain-containing protein n=1 Tax=Kuraishia capsulata CBS 1993 TaxID=1382522 RepID=W6MT20_9ASCO|nr:uncharacterized protein KUCA_T00000892001 [Kuraishia capsulata CBS 1993]CDK24925.1 unnamed protein product [Kuraishia capsulata CBS 1993]
MGKHQKFAIGNEMLQSFPSPSAAVIDVPAPPPRQNQPIYPQQKQQYPPHVQQSPQPPPRFPPPPQQVHTPIQRPIQRQQPAIRQQIIQPQPLSARPKAPQQLEVSRLSSSSSASSIYTPAGDIGRRVASDTHQNQGYWSNSRSHSRSGSETIAPRLDYDYELEHTYRSRSHAEAVQIPRPRNLRSPVRLNLIDELHRLWKEKVPMTLERSEVRSLLELVRTVPRRSLIESDLADVLFNPDRTPFKSSATRMLFHSYCASPKGLMTDEEFLDLCECLRHMETTYYKNDTNANGAMGFDEFKTTMLGHRISQRTIWSIFQVYASSSGEIKLDSFIECCCAMTKALEISQVVEYGYDHGIAISKNNFFKEFIRLRQ